MIKFTRKEKIELLEEGIEYYGIIRNIVKIVKKNYYDVRIEVTEGIISIWVTDDITPEHPLFDIFDKAIGDTDVEVFDEKEIIGTKIRFKVKNIQTIGLNNKQVIRSFFDEVTQITENKEVTNNG